MRNIFHKYGKWLPIGTYTHGHHQYVAFARKNLTTGMIQFKSKLANKSLNKADYLPHDLIDTKQAWKEVTSQELEVESNYISKDYLTWKSQIPQH